MLSMRVAMMLGYLRAAAGKGLPAWWWETDSKALREAYLIGMELFHRTEK